MNNDRRGLIPNPGGSLPPLPDPLPPFPVPPFPDPPAPEPPVPEPRLPRPFPQPYPVPRPWPPFRIRSLRSGCYLLRLTSRTNLLSVADGTLRVESHSNGRTASGDLYQRKIFQIPLPPPPGYPRRGWFPILAPGPNPADGIPILPRDRYRHYLRVTQMLEWFTIANSFTLGFEMHRFDSATRTWTNEGSYTARMSWITAPDGYPSSGDYLEGDVKNSAGIVVARLTMGWVSKYLRRAVVEIDRVSASEGPLDNGAGLTWQRIFDQVGWEMTAYVSDTIVTEPSGEGWSIAECHQGMLDWRDSADLDRQWRYHLLCVRRLDATSRGIMYDAYGGDSNNIPREGAALASHWTFPDADPWGKCKAQRFGTATGPYFRTGVHEISHAMMMFHPSGASGNHIMQVTPQIAANAVTPVEFPDNIDWSFSTEDQRWLRHLPDVVVRPGTVLRFGTDVGPAYTGIPISPLDVVAEIEGLEVQVSPLLEAVPLGAPARVNFRLVNNGPEPVPVPGRVSLKAGNVAGKVIDPSGTVRTFSTIVRYLDEAGEQMLEPKQSLGDSLTLLRGPDGALFPSPGLHQVVVTLTWDAGGCLVRLSGATSVMVTPPADDEHAKAALRILDTPDTLVALAVGGDHLTEGNEAIRAAIDNPVLRPHFAYIEAKRLAQRFKKRKAKLTEAAKLLVEDAVMSPAEIRKAAELVEAEGTESAPGKSIVKTLKGKASMLDVSDEIKTIVDSL